MNCIHVVCISSVKADKPLHKAFCYSVVTTAPSAEHTYSDDTLLCITVISSLMLLNSSGVASVKHLLISCFLLGLSDTYAANIDSTMLLHVLAFKYLQTTKFHLSYICLTCGILKSCQNMYKHYKNEFQGKHYFN